MTATELALSDLLLHAARRVRQLTLGTAVASAAPRAVSIGPVADQPDVANFVRYEA